jgi:hypothetical protein
MSGALRLEDRTAGVQRCTPARRICRRQGSRSTPRSSRMPGGQRETKGGELPAGSSASSDADVPRSPPAVISDENQSVGPAARVLPHTAADNFIFRSVPDTVVPAPLATRARRVELLHPWPSRPTVGRSSVPEGRIAPGQDQPTNSGPERSEGLLRTSIPHPDVIHSALKGRNPGQGRSLTALSCGNRVSERLSCSSGGRSISQPASAADLRPVTLCRSWESWASRHCVRRGGSWPSPGVIARIRVSDPRFRDSLPQNSIGARLGALDAGFDAFRAATPPSTNPRGRETYVQHTIRGARCQASQPETDERSPDDPGTLLTPKGAALRMNRRTRTSRRGRGTNGS